jgi:AcrR family transcriptional regulator
MNKTEAKRQQILEKIADHLLVHGLLGASLRPLAAAVGTSDRMLLHYFVNKEDLITAALTLVAERMIHLLEDARSAPLPFHLLMPHLAGMLKNPQIQPYLRLWLELAALSAGGETAYQEIAQSISQRFYEWLAASLQVENEAERDQMAALAFVTIEGFVFLDAFNAHPIIASALEGIAAHSAGGRDAQ